jgi:hypothetical protein
VTGQQKKLHPHSTHIACTIEMADITKVIDCAVIDEIQMITDPMRGWAWTRAVLAIPAKTIHLCGNESILVTLYPTSSSSSLQSSPPSPSLSSPSNLIFLVIYFIKIIIRNHKINQTHHTHHDNHYHRTIFSIFSLLLLL